MKTTDAKSQGMKMSHHRITGSIDDALYKSTSYITLLYIEIAEHEKARHENVGCEIAGPESDRPYCMT